MKEFNRKKKLKKNIYSKMKRKKMPIVMDNQMHIYFTINYS